MQALQALFMLSPGSRVWRSAQENTDTLASAVAVNKTFVSDPRFTYLFQQNLIIFYLLCNYSCPNFSLFSHLHPASPHSLRQSLPYCPCPCIMHICSLATLFPTLHFTSPWLFSNYWSVLLNSFNFFRPSLHPNLATNKMFSVSMIPFLFCLFILFFRFSCWQICICCHFVVHVFGLLNEDSLTRRIILVWWWWTASVFSCLASSLFVLWFSMIVLLDRVILVVSLCFSSL